MTPAVCDTVSHLDVARQRQRLCLQYYDANGLRWAIDEAMRFFGLSRRVRQKQVARVMQEAEATFTHANTAAAYVELYEKMLQRPLLPQTEADDSQSKQA